MVIHRSTRSISHFRFSDLPQFLNRGELLVMNDSKVFKARLNATRPSGGKVEILLIRALPTSLGKSDTHEDWEGMVRPSGRVKAGELLRVSPTLSITAVDRVGEGRWRVRFQSKRERAQIIASAGHIPLPPYMRRGDEPTDIRRYQTVFARKNAIGSVAAPTAGFHFTKGLLQRIESHGVKTSRVTLHVGPGTFLPVHTDHLGEHEMESEMAELSRQTVDLIAKTKEKKKRVIAVGTTTVRTLESAPIQNGLPVPYHKPVNLFIRPGFRFQVVDALITNFHLPRSTLLVLVSTFAGREMIHEAYQAAIREKYRFYSYGDAMLIL